MDAIVTFDGSGRVELFNQAAEKVFRCSAAQALGAPLDRFLTGELRRAVESAMQGMAGRQTTHCFLLGRTQLYALRANGEKFPIEATISFAQAGQRRLFTLILRDIDERRRAE